jgi:hypothetical protein
MAQKSNKTTTKKKPTTKLERERARTKAKR